MEEQIKVEKAGWNLAEHFISQLAGLIQGASRYYIECDYIKAFAHMRAARMLINPNLSAEEKTALLDLERKFVESLKQTIAKGFEQTEKIALAKVQVFLLYGEYSDKVMDLLKKYGFLVPPKEDKTKLN